MAYFGTPPVIPKNGGTGVVNANTSTITLGGAFAMSGAHTFVGTLTGNTTVTFPTSGTLATTGQLPANPLPVANGGTGDTSVTAYAPIVGGTTTTGPFQSASTGISSSGYVLTSNGNAAVPSFQALPASGITWQIVNSGFVPAVGNGYFMDFSTFVSVVISDPSTVPVGSLISFTNYNGNSFAVSAGSNTIKFGNVSRTGPSNGFESTTVGDVINLVSDGVSAWWVNSSIGNWTLA